MLEKYNTPGNVVPRIVSFMHHNNYVMNACIFSLLARFIPSTRQSISSVQHDCILFFIFFSFFKHLKREKFNTNNFIKYDVIIY